MAKTLNYTVEQTASMIDAYTSNPSQVTVESIALALGKTVRSVVAKLSREKVYIAKTYATKTGEKVVKKDTVADSIGVMLTLTEAETSSLVGANKTALKKILEALVRDSVDNTPLPEIDPDMM